MMEMKKLAINTALKITSIAIIDGEKVVAEKSWLSENDEAERLMPEINELLKSKKVKYEDLKGIIVIRGPGSFTGLRVGIAAANMMSYMLSIPISSIDTFAFLWEINATLNEKKENSALTLFAGKKELYIQLKKGAEPLLKSLEDSKEFLKKAKVKTIFGSIVGEQEKELKNLKFIKSKKSFGETIAEIPSKDFKKEKIIKPLYIKGPAIMPPKKII